MSSVWRRAISIVIVLPLAIAVQQWPAPPAMAAPWKATVQQVKSVPVSAAQKNSARVGGTAKFVPADITWPMAEEATVDLTSRRRGDRVRVGTTPIRVAAPADVKVAPSVAKVRVLDRAATDHLVGPGVVAVLQTVPGAETTIDLDYSSFAAAAGAGYASRFRLFSLPASAVTTPDQA